MVPEIKRFVRPIARRAVRPIAARAWSRAPLNVVYRQLGWYAKTNSTGLSIKHSSPEAISRSIPDGGLSILRERR